MFSASYRDIHSLPYISGLERNKAELYGRLVYFLGALVLATSVLSFSIFDALKDQKITVTSTKTSGSCRMLSSLNFLEYSSEVYSWLVKGVSDASTLKYFNGLYGDAGFGTGGTPSPQIKYKNAFYTTYQECLDSYSVSCKVEYANFIPTAGTGHYDVPITCSFTDSISLFGLDGKQVSCYLGSFCTKDSLTNEIMTETMKTLLTASKICAPFESLPPYQCTSYSTKSYLEILSQSFAISSAFIGILFPFSVLLLSVFSESMKTQKNLPLQSEIELSQLDVSTDGEEEKPPNQYASNPNPNHQVFVNNDDVE